MCLLFVNNPFSTIFAVSIKVPFMSGQDKLFNRNYLFLCGANFMFFFSFYLLLPVLPFYIRQNFGVGNSVVGAVISCYTVAALCVRPFSGYIMDTYKRKPVYLLALTAFTLIFFGYVLAATVAMLVAVRIMHGLSFGLTSVSGNTLVIDVVPSEKRGEGIGYFGIANNMAMALGPMTGLFVCESYSFNVIFIGCALCSLLAVLLSSQIKTRYRPPLKRPPLSLDRFVLVEGLPAGLSLMLIAFAYGQISNYIALYAKEMGLAVSSGLFFTVYSVGMIGSRFYSGRMVDKGKVTHTIALGLSILVFSLFGLSVCGKVNTMNASLTVPFFLLVALCCGMGFGTSFPAFNSLFVNLAPNSRRGTATSTYLTSWDIGLGIGILSGGLISEHLSFSSAYFFADVAVLVSLVFFLMVVVPRYHRDKIR